MVTLLYFLISVACILLSRLPNEVASLWFGNALVVGTLWRRPAWNSNTLYGGVFVATLAANLITGTSVVLSIGLTAANMIELLLALILMRRFCPLERRVPDPVPFLNLIAIVLASAAVGALAASLMLYESTGGALVRIWWTWWSGSVLGALALLPLMVTVSRKSLRQTLKGSRRWELAGFLAFSIPFTIIVLGTLPYPFAVVSLPLVAAALRLSTLAVAAMIGTMIATVVVTGSMGLIGSQPAELYILGSSLQFSTGLAILPAFFVALVLGRQKQDQLALRESEHRFRTAMENSAIGMALVNLDGNWGRVNHAVCEMLGYSPEELRRLNFQAVTHPDDLITDLAEVGRIMSGEIDTYRMEKRYIRKDGQVIWVLLAVSIVRDPNTGSPLYFISQMEDIDRRKRTEEAQIALSEALFEEKERLRTTLYSIGDAVMSTDAAQHITFMNPIAEQLTGWSMAEAAGRRLDEVFKLIDEATGEAAPSPVEACLANLQPFYLHGDMILIDRFGERRSVQDSAAPIRKSTGEVIGSVLVFQDVTKARRLQRELAYSALHDALTDLPNRKALEQGILMASEQARLYHRRYSLCFIDLDRFKVINDSAGHAAGDALLREVASTIRAQLREGDLTARLGGDEFAVLLPDCSIENAEPIATNLVETIGAMTFIWEDRVYAPDASIGITEITGSAEVAAIMSQADAACFAAKAAGRNRISLYRPEESEAKRYHQDIQIASGIRAAISADRFRIFAQEILDLRQDGRQRPYFELLLRLEDENGKMILPGNFIPAAERYDLMGELDRWLLRTTMRSFGPRLHAARDTSLAINLSANSLNDPSLWSFVQKELADSGIAPGRLHFEITETALINNLNAANQFVTAARAADCHITLDDFGSGLSSFPYLRQFPVDQLKIDGNFIRQMKTSMADRTIVEAINDLGHRFGAATIAEFVEDAETLAMVRDLGIDKAQGFFIGRPAPLEVVI